jgi:hypothetical protein
MKSDLTGIGRRFRIVCNQKCYKHGNEYLASIKTRNIWSGRVTINFYGRSFTVKNSWTQKWSQNFVEVR